MRRLAEAGAALALLALSACVQFTEDALPRRSIDAVQRSKIDEVAYAFEASHRGTPAPLNEAFCHVVLESGLRRLFAEVRAPAEQAPLHLHVTMGARPETMGEAVWNEFTILTAYLLPWRRPVQYELVAEATWQGRPLKTYRYEDSMSLWIWWGFLPFMVTNFPRNETGSELIHNMIANFIGDLAADVATLPLEGGSP